MQNVNDLTMRNNVEMLKLCQRDGAIVQVMGTNTPEHGAPLSKFLRQIVAYFETKYNFFLHFE